MQSAVGRNVSTALVRLLPFVLGLLAGTPMVAVERTEPLPAQLEGVGITAKIDNPLPLQLEFEDEDGRVVRLGKYFEHDRPVLLTLGYYGCPMLCDLVLNGLVDGLQEIEWTPGSEFEVVTVSINPLETHQLARLKKQNYLTEYGRAGAGAGWHFLTGREDQIKSLADAVGFGYRYDESRGEYAHGAGVFLCTSDGRLSRFIGGIRFEPRTLRLSLVDASAGKVGSLVDQVVLYCYHYDAGAGRYAPAAMNIMRAGGALTVVILALALAILWLRDAARSRVAVGRAHL
ncbi:MAG: SCO family protein [Acidobacteria bacterium]|nr:SCO family protein [Acidobacteriota bacterium]